MQLPDGEDTNEWLAVHGESRLRWSIAGDLDVDLAVDFFNHLNMLYGTITEFCIPQEVRFPHDYYNPTRSPAHHSACPVSDHVCRTAVSISLFTRVLLPSDVWFF